MYCASLNEIMVNEAMKNSQGHTQGNVARYKNPGRFVLTILTLFCSDKLRKHFITVALILLLTPSYITLGILVLRKLCHLGRPKCTSISAKISYCVFTIYLVWWRPSDLFVVYFQKKSELSWSTFEKEPQNLYFSAHDHFFDLINY